uniref:Uncharacterized protein n=1 Tax=Arundo donax TaxID=35708 RepID=A0A0A9GLK0_ARUDO
MLLKNLHFPNPKSWLNCQAECNTALSNIVCTWDHRHVTQVHKCHPASKLSAN